MDFAYVRELALADHLFKVVDVQVGDDGQLLGADTVLGQTQTRVLFLVLGPVPHTITCNTQTNNNTKNKTKQKKKKKKKVSKKEKKQN